jgi:hypothetical protein
MLLLWTWMALPADLARIDLTDWPVKVTGEAQLFVDDHLIARQAGVTFRVHVPEKHPFDWGVIHVTANPPFRVGDKLYIYYGGYGSTHATRLRDIRKFGIGLAMLRPDGFVSVEGYRVEDSTPVEGDGLAISVRWKDKECLPASVNHEQVRIQFELENASLYSFRIE